jgi:dTDP-4-amino-4,6-dideoxygalactose transaminase
MKPVPFLEPSLPPPDEIAADYAAIAARGIFTNGGPVEREFAQALERWIGSGVHVAVTSSCTSALELALQALIDEPGGVVLVPSFTFAAAALAVTRMGHEPVFVDVDPLTWQPDPADARNLLSKLASVRGVVVTSTFGVANDHIAEWERLAHERSVPLIVDSAAGFGGAYGWGEPLGARGDCEVFSLHATKVMAVGEGGVLASRDASVVARVEKLRNFGFDEERQATMIGTNAKLTELAAAIGLRQLDRLASRIEARQRILRTYMRYLQPLGAEFQSGAERSPVAFVSALLRTEALRDAWVRAFHDAHIECRTYYNPPVHRQSVFATRGTNRALPVTDDISARVVSLPTSDGLDPEIIRAICAVAAGVP